MNNEPHRAAQWQRWRQHSGSSPSSSGGGSQHPVQPTSMSVLPASSNIIIRYVLMDLEESTLLSVPTSSRPT